nr:hypothetical protein [Streptomyces aureus]
MAELILVSLDLAPTHVDHETQNSHEGLGHHSDDGVDPCGCHGRRIGDYSDRAGDGQVTPQGTS